MNMTKGTRIILLSIAALLIAGALLLTLENKDVVTVFTRDGKAELCFIQRISSGEIMPLTKE